MTDDPLTLEKLRTDWHGVRLLRSKIDRVIKGSATLPGSFTLLIADAAHNLPFLQACAVLNDALAYLRGVNPRTPLGSLVKAHRDALSWVNYQLIKKIVCDRNALAHRATFVSRGTCWRYIDAIEAELVAWGIVLPVNDEVAP
jgi:hypothetical protein